MSLAPSPQSGPPVIPWQRVAEIGPNVLGSGVRTQVTVVGLQ